MRLCLVLSPARQVGWHGVPPPKVRKFATVGPTLVIYHRLHLGDTVRRGITVSNDHGAVSRISLTLKVGNADKIVSSLDSLFTLVGSRPAIEIEDEDACFRCDQPETKNPSCFECFIIILPIWECMAQF